MTDLLIWLVTIALAFIILRYVPMNVSVKGRLILWLSGSLISSLALLATITYAFWMGVLAAVALGVVFTVLLQEKAPQVFLEGKGENTATPDISTPLIDDHDYSNPNQNDQEHIIEEQESDEIENSYSNEELLHNGNLLQEITGEDQEGERNHHTLESAEIEGGYSPSDDTEVELKDPDGEFQEKDDKTELSAVGEMQPQEDEFSIDNNDDEESLMEEELAQLRMEEKSLVDEEDLDDAEDITEDELMAERNLQLDFEKADLELDPMESEEMPRTENITNLIFKDEDLEPEEDIVYCMNKSTDSDKDITREMNNEDQNIREGIVAIPYQDDIDPDIEDNEDSLALEVDNEEELVADEALRKQLLELMIEKIELMEEQMSVLEYEEFIKAHLSDSLSDLEYYCISKFLIKQYIKNGKIDELELFVGELIDRFALYSLLVEELKYVLQQQVHYTK
ncbi:hypothetical protein [Halobacillus trueperi]|uniref:hypothetical protein n=1 Tax=Halobacillus trueperi TaxID=156205 RepID=UPI003735A04A